MTPEALEKLVRKGKPRQVFEAVRDLDDASRKKLSAPMTKLNRAIRTGDGLVSGRMDWEKEDKVRQKWDKVNKHIFISSDLATLACCPAKECHRVRLFWGSRERFGKQITDILIKRNPDWLDTWVKNRISTEWPEIDWEMVRAFYEAGVIEKPQSDGYVNLFVGELNSYDWQKPQTYVSASKRLLEKPDYLEEDIWRIFETENQALTYDYTERSGRGPEKYEPWRVVIATLVEQGHMDRDRTLDATLSALDNEFKQNYLTAYAKLHEFLKPTAEEMKARESVYVELLSNPTGPIVSFAVRMLAKLQRSGSLDAELYLASASPVFGHKTKGSASQALKIAAGLLAKNDSLQEATVMFAISGMAHPSPDVQDQALNLIEPAAATVSDNVRQQFERQIANLTTKLQARARGMLGDDVVAESEQAADVDMAEMAAEIAALPEDIRHLAGLAGPDWSTKMPSALDYNIHDLPRLPDAVEFVRIETAEELLELAAHLIEVVDSAEQIEQLLDGIARLGSQRDGNFSKLAAPLIQRIEKGAGGSAYGLGSYWAGMPLVMIDLIMTWLTGKTFNTPHGQWYTATPTWVPTMARLREIQQLLIEQKPARLLSTPSYVGGWIEPSAFVRRVREHLDNGQKVYAADMMYGLLRLSPVGRKEALEAAADLPGEEGTITRFALGGDDRPTKKDKRFANVWLCAGRARDVDGSLREPLEAVAGEIPDLPNHLDPSGYPWAVHNEGKSRGYEFLSIKFDSLPAEDVNNPQSKGIIGRIAKGVKGKTRWEKWPVGAMHIVPENSWGAFYEMSSPWRIEWFAMQWPLNPEPGFQYGSQMLEKRLDEDTSRDAPGHVFLNGLFDPSRCWGDMAHLALCLGLASKSADARGFAVDAAIAGIESGRASTASAIDIFTKLLRGGMLKLNRLAMTLQQVLDVSPLHRWWVATVINGVVARAAEPPKNGHFLYEIALDSMAPLQRTPTSDMAAILGKLKGNSKAAKLARELLNLEGATIDEAPASALAEALQARLQFARSLIS